MGATELDIPGPAVLRFSRLRLRSPIINRLLPQIRLPGIHLRCRLANGIHFARAEIPGLQMGLFVPRAWPVSNGFIAHRNLGVASSVHFPLLGPRNPQRRFSELYTCRCSPVATPCAVRCCLAMRLPFRHKVRSRHACGTWHG